MPPLRPTTRITTLLATAVLLSGFSCNQQSRTYAVASDAIAHALLNAQQAARQGATDGVISVYDENIFEGYLSKTSRAGMALNSAIRTNQSKAAIAPLLASFLQAFDILMNTGLAGIKDPKLQIALSTILNGAEASLGVISAGIGGQ